MYYIYIYIEKRKSDLIAHIKGSSQKIPINFGFELDAGGSFDPENLNKTDALTYAWSCTEVSPNANGDCIQKDGNPLGSILQGECRVWVPKDIFAPNIEMRFSILVKEQPYPAENPRSASQSILVTTQPSASFQVRIEESGKSAPTKGYCPQRGINLQAVIRQSVDTGDAGNSSPPAYKWSSNILNLSEEYLPAPLGKYLKVPPQSPSLINSPSLQVKVDVLLGSLTISASIELKINKSPTGGDLTFSPNTGIAIVTLFTFHTTGWTDNDLPLSYALFYSLTPIHTHTTHNIWKLLVQKTSIGNDLGGDLLLPQGNSLNSYLLYVKLRVADIYGSSTEYIKELTVSPFPTSGFLGNSLFAHSTQILQSVPDSSLHLVLQV